MNGPASFLSAQIGRELEVTGSKFLHETSDVDFSRLSAGARLFMSRATFNGGLSCRYSNIDLFLRLDGATSNGRVDFQTTRIRGDAYLNNATFNEEVAFVTAIVDVDLIGTDTKFKGSDRSLDLRRVTVNGVVNLNGASFGGSALIADANVTSISMASKKRTSVLRDLDFSRTVVERDIALHGARVHNLLARSAKVAGLTSISNVEIGAGAVLSHARFGTLRIVNLRSLGRDIQPKAEDARLSLDGMTFEHFVLGEPGTVDKSDEVWEALQPVLQDAIYSPSGYVSAESHLRSLGDAMRADAVMMARRSEERDTGVTGWTDRLTYGWTSDFVAEWLTGYGRETWRAAAPAALVILIGSFVFRKKRMEPKKEEDADLRYCPFIYSIDKFMPVFNLKAADTWRVREDSHWLLWSYQHVHGMLGWLAIPFLVAAVTGIIK